MSINIKNEIKEEAKKVDELIKEDKEKISKRNDMDTLFTIGFFVLTSIFISSGIFIEGTDNLKDNRLAPIMIILLCLCSSLISLFINAISHVIIKSLMKNTVNSNIKNLSIKYLISKEKRLYFYNKYQELKIYSKDYLCYVNNYNKELSLEEREKGLAKLYIESKDYNFFVDYLKNENKELVFEEDYIQNLIYKKTKKCLESIKSINEFNNIKEDLIYTIDLIDLIDKKLELFEIMEKLKDQYDSEVINEKIGNIKDKLLNKNDNKIEIKKSNIRSI